VTVAAALVRVTVVVDICVTKEVWMTEVILVTVTVMEPPGDWEGSPVPPPQFPNPAWQPSPQ